MGLQGWVLRPFTEAEGGGGETEKVAEPSPPAPAQLQQLLVPLWSSGGRGSIGLAFSILRRRWYAHLVLVVGCRSRWGCWREGPGQLAGLSAVNILGCYSSRSSQAPVLPSLLSTAPSSQLCLSGAPQHNPSQTCVFLFSPRDGGEGAVVPRCSLQLLSGLRARGWVCCAHPLLTAVGPLDGAQIRL